MEKKIIAVVILLCCITAIGIFLKKEQVAKSKDIAAKELLDDFSVDILTEGKRVYGFYCERCHMTQSEHNFLGKGMWEKLPKKDGSKFIWLKAYMKNTNALIESGDKYAKSLKEEYNNAVSHRIKLTDEELLALIVFIENDM